MRYFSMFSGIGGFELGINRAFSIWDGAASPTEAETSKQGLEPATTSKSNDRTITSRTSPGEPGQVLCVGYSEIDKYAIETYKHNFGEEVRNYGDATTINTNELPDFDLLVGGFPCQAFSVAGRRAGFNDTRGTLFFDIARILRDKRPRHFVLENVKGLLSHDTGKTFQTILEVLTDTGYDVSWSVHNSKNYGVPQNRERIYIIGNLRGERRPQVFPSNQENTDDTRHTGKEVSRTVEANYYKGVSPNGHQGAGRQLVQLNNPTHSNDRVYSDAGISPTLNTMQGGLRQPFIKGEARIRRLTPTECERLQGFPDNWTIGSDTQRYKQCGNAVTVNVVESVIKQMQGE